jgi:hypothetical protein
VGGVRAPLNKVIRRNLEYNFDSNRAITTSFSNYTQTTKVAGRRIEQGASLYSL